MVRHRTVLPCMRGETAYVIINPTAPPVHPHMRREQVPAISIDMETIGSSPHARGTLPVFDTLFCCDRFIPACAGNTHFLARLFGPRDGSSPHARGTPQAGHHRQEFGWFIPACAGNTAARAAPAPGAAVHPRMRGEHRRCSRYPPERFGSSPHARGTQHPGHLGRQHLRFIPACAGNTPAST